MVPSLYILSSARATLVDIEKYDTSNDSGNKKERKKYAKIDPEGQQDISAAVNGLTMPL